VGRDDQEPEDDEAVGQAARRLEQALDRLRAAMRGGTIDLDEARRALEDAERELEEARRRLHKKK
jgi:hypothetical protein